jgi:metal-responsive CopG/Arc/MetJ family transcriptional regulator
MIAVRIDDRLLEGVDRERRRHGMSRAKVIHDALAMWVDRQRFAEAVREEHVAYERSPVGEAEFGSVLGAQKWPK